MYTKQAVVRPLTTVCAPSGCAPDEPDGAATNSASVPPRGRFTETTALHAPLLEQATVEMRPNDDLSADDDIVASSQAAVGQRALHQVN